MKDEYLFVYGTLRKAAGHAMHQVVDSYCKFISDGSVQGRLYEVAGYPGVVESTHETDRVLGELYQIIDRDSIVPVLDDYEGCTDAFSQPHAYIRKKCAVRTVNGESYSAWVYLYNYDVARLYQINSGDYLDFLDEGIG